MDGDQTSATDKKGMRTGSHATSSHCLCWPCFKMYMNVISCSYAKAKWLGSKSRVSGLMHNTNFSLPICLSFHMIQIWRKGRLHVQKKKKNQVKVSWKKEKGKKSCGRSGGIWFLKLSRLSSALKDPWPYISSEPEIPVLSLWLIPVRAPYLWTMSDHRVCLLFQFSLLKSLNYLYNWQHTRLISFLSMQQ